MTFAERRESELLSATRLTIRFSRPYTTLGPSLARERPRAVAVQVFAVVGLTERYETFYAMLAALLPAAPAGFWEREVARRENPSVKSTAAVLALLSPRASAALDRALRYERIIYDAAVVVHDRRCLEHLGSERCAARGGRAPS